MAIWISIEDNILKEIEARLLDGNRFLLDKYLDAFSKFISFVDNCEDKVFLSHLRSGKAIESFDAVLFGNCVGWNDYVNDEKLSQEDLLYLVARLDGILKQSTVFGEAELLDSCGNFLWDASFVDSAEYKAALDIVGKMFSKKTTETACDQ